MLAYLLMSIDVIQAEELDASMLRKGAFNPHPLMIKKK